MLFREPQGDSVRPLPYRVSKQYKFAVYFRETDCCTVGAFTHNFNKIICDYLFPVCFSLPARAVCFCFLEEGGWREEEVDFQIR